MPTRDDILAGLALLALFPLVWILLTILEAVMHG